MNEDMVLVPTTLVRSSRLTGYKIINNRGDNLGQSETFLVDLCYWKMPFIVASFGGIEGLGSKWYIIPYEIISFNTRKKKFILGVSKNVIQKAPGIDKNVWGAKPIDRCWLSGICHYYNVVPYWEMIG